MLPSYIQGMNEHLTHGMIGILYPRLYRSIHLLPESWHGAHTRRIGLADGLLHVFCVGKNYHSTAFGDAQQAPSLLEDMSIR